MPGWMKHKLASGFQGEIDTSPCNFLMSQRLKAREEGVDRGWDGWMASPTQWMWFWANSRRWWKTGQLDVLQYMGSQSQTRLSDWTTRLRQSRERIKIVEEPHSWAKTQTFLESGCCKNMRPVGGEGTCWKWQTRADYRTGPETCQTMVYTSDLLGGGKPCFWL